MKFQAKLILQQLLLLSTWCCDKAQSFALSPHHSSISSGRRRRFHHRRRRRQVRIATPSPSTTTLNYRSDSDLPDDSPSLPSSNLPQTTKKSGGSDKNNNEAQKEKQRQKNRRGPPIRRSFLHQLDRFLTELQGTVCSSAASNFLSWYCELSFLCYLFFQTLSLHICMQERTTTFAKIHSSLGTLHPFRKSMCHYMSRWWKDRYQRIWMVPFVGMVLILSVMCRRNDTIGLTDVSVDSLLPFTILFLALNTSLVVDCHIFACAHLLRWNLQMPCWYDHIHLAHITQLISCINLSSHTAMSCAHIISAHANVQEWRGTLHQPIHSIAALFHRARTGRRVLPYDRRV